MKHPFDRVQVAGQKRNSLDCNESGRSYWSHRGERQYGPNIVQYWMEKFDYDEL
jgi:hypothetical protein